MKSLVSITAVTVALALPGTTASRGQQAVDNSPAEARQMKLEAEKQLDEAQQQFTQAREAYRQLAQTSGSSGASSSQGGPFTERLVQVRRSAATGTNTAPGALVQRLQAIERGIPDGPGKTLVIFSADAPEKAQANLEEDLAVMSRIFDKALEDKLGGQTSARTAMGINVLFAPGSSPVRSLYLDGYGALFMMNVNFPLLPSPAKPEAQKEAAPADSTWEEAKRDLYGSGTEAQSGSSPAVEFSEEKVSKLKDALLEALKNATNIRNLKSDDSITVCVFGGANAGATAARTSSNVRIVPIEGSEPFTASATSVVADNRTHQLVVTTGGDDSASRRGTILTIRVKKSDADAFAKGKLNLDEFRKKASVTAYAGGTGGGYGSGSVMLVPGSTGAARSW